MVIGGGQLYLNLALPMAHSEWFSPLIDIEPKADTWFPEWDKPVNGNQPVDEQPFSGG